MSIGNIRTFFRFPKVKVVGDEYDPEGDKIVIYLDRDKRYHPCCSKCGHTGCSIHSYEHRDIRDMSLTSTMVVLRYTYRKVRCPSCGIRVEESGFVAPYARVTKRFANYIFMLCQYMTIVEASHHNDLNWKTVKDIDKEGIRERLAQDDQKVAPILAVDEISIKRGHKYLTVVADHKQGKVLWMKPDRKESTLAAYFTSLTEPERTAIQSIALDMWDPYIKAIQTHCPHAAIVFDFFHVVRNFHRVIDVIRNTEYRTASAADRSVVQGTKYILYKNKENLKPDEKPKLKKLLSLNTNISLTYILKDYLKKLWYYTSPAWARKFLNHWCDLAQQSGLQPLKQFARMLQRYAYGIINHCLFPIHTSKLEGINNKIKVIKRKAYGFLDLEYFILKVKFATFSCN